MNIGLIKDGQNRITGKSISVFSSLDSTNSYCKRHAHLLTDGHLVIAKEQPGGRGRQGKSFYCPENGGLYMSITVKNEKAVKDELFTVKSCLAVCNAIDRLCDFGEKDGVGIKWVNDIYFSGKKLCGILCERFTDKNGSECVIAGFGINFRLDMSRIPSELRKTVISLYDITKKNYNPAILAKYICEEFEKLLYGDEISVEEVISLYKKRSVVIGKQISIMGDGVEQERAAVLDICPDGALLVRTKDGETKKLCGGEITIRVKK